MVWQHTTQSLYAMTNEKGRPSKAALSFNKYVLYTLSDNQINNLLRHVNQFPDLLAFDPLGGFRSGQHCGLNFIGSHRKWQFHVETHLAVERNRVVETVFNCFRFIVNREGGFHDRIVMA